MTHVKQDSTAKRFVDAWEAKQAHLAAQIAAREVASIDLDAADFFHVYAFEDGSKAGLHNEDVAMRQAWVIGD
jgi:hypothetical protein